MASTVVVTTTVQWTPPSAPTNSGQSSSVTQASYNAQNVGTVDVPSGTTPSTVISIPFGSVAKARVLKIRSFLTSDVDVKLSGSSDVNFTLAPGASITYEASADPTTGTHPITAATITILVAPTVLERVEFHCFGD